MPRFRFPAISPIAALILATCALVLSGCNGSSAASGASAGSTLTLDSTAPTGSLGGATPPQFGCSLSSVTLAAGPTPTSAELTAAIEVSSQMAAAPPNSQAVIQGSSITLLAQSDGPNLFQIASTDLAAARTLEIQGSFSAFVMINITGGPSVQMQDLTMSLSGGVAPHHILFNFPEARSLDLSQVNFDGAVLAPLASVSLSSGAMDGQVVASSFSDGGTVNFDPYVGCLPLPGAVLPSNPSPQM